jgi:FKBP-type peptidyl-prolyl cis-trans isomerase FkpA
VTRMSLKYAVPGLAVTAALIAALSGCQAKAPQAGPSAAGSALPKTEDEKTIYALGANLGSRFVAPLKLTPAELEILKKGLTDVSGGGPSGVPLEVYTPKIEALAHARAAVGATAEKAKGESFRNTAAHEPGAVKTNSGLIYRTLTPGRGPSPTGKDVVKVHYQGTLIDGTVFDSSIARGQPIDFPLSGVIPCWTEGVQRMKVGEKARLVCPSEIAYGDQGHPPAIPGGATLVFEVELLAIRK